MRPRITVKVRLIERPPKIFRWFFPSALFRVPRDKRGEKEIFLTFDDGPVASVTPQVLDILDHYGARATFFMVGDNVRRHPTLLAEVRRRGHSVGNHTMHHLQGSHVTTKRYLRDVMEAHELIQSSLFRPPHGWMRWRQLTAMRKVFTPVMYDLVTRDYSWRLTADDVVANVRKLTRPGSIIVFHDSEKAAPRMLEALPRALQWLNERGYTYGLLKDSEQQKCPTVDAPR